MELPLGAEGWDGQAQAWVETMSYAYGWVFLAWAIGAGALLLLMTLLFVPATRRRFWCVVTRRAVEVVFEEYGLPGRRRPVAVLSCSAFDPPTDVRCTCACLSCAGRVLLAESPPVEQFPLRSLVGSGATRAVKVRREAFPRQSSKVVDAQTGESVFRLPATWNREET